MRAPPRARRSDLVGAAGAGLLALAAAAWALKLWRADLSVPFRYSSDDDTMFYLSAIKGIIDHGWLLTNHSLGAPFGQQLYDFPQGADNLDYLILKGLTTAWPSPAAINLFFLSTFPLDAVVAYCVIRRLEVSLPAAIACSVLFALLPYHFFRSDSHLFLSAYWSLPLSAYLFIRVLEREPLFARRPGGRVTWASRRTLRTLLICLAIASTGLYYAVFGVVLIGAGALIAAVARRGRATVAAGAVAAGAIAAVVAINLAPSLVYRASHGANTVVTRSAGAGDELAMSASYLVLPPLHDRIGPLRRITERYAAQTQPHGYCEQCYESLGLVGDAGLLSLGVALVAACFGGAGAGRVQQLRRSAAVGVAVCLAVGVTGALSSLARVFASSDIRAWNRLSVVIAFLALVAAGWLLDAARRRWPSSAAVFGGLCAGVALFGILEQTSAFFVPPYGRDAREYRSDARFVATIEQRLPASASIFELPYVPFPEGYQPSPGPGQTIPYVPQVGFEYDQARGYVHSRGLSWSYGAMKGRSADWESQLAAKPVGMAVAGAAAAGFDGVVLDPRGYPGTWPAVLSGLRRQLGPEPLWSPDHDLVFFDLRPYLGRLRARDPAAVAPLRAAVLTPLRLSCAPGRLTVENPDRAPRRATLVAAERGRSQPARTALVLRPGATVVRVPGVALVAPAVIDEAFAPVSARGASTVAAGIVGPPCTVVGAPGTVPREPG